MKSSKIPKNISKMASEPFLEDVESFCLRHEAEKKKQDINRCWLILTDQFQYCSC